MERFSYHCRMTNPDLSSILDDLAAGRIDTAEANRRISALKTDTGSESGSGSRQEEAPKGKPGGLTRVAITAVGRRVRIEGDPSVSTLSVEGPHVLRRNGETMEVSSTGEAPASTVSPSSAHPGASKTFATSASARNCS